MVRVEGRRKGNKDREGWGQRHVGPRGPWVEPAFTESETLLCVRSGRPDLCLLYLLRWSCGLSFIVLIYYIDICIFNQPCLPWINPLLVMVSNHIYVWPSLASLYFVKDFCICIHKDIYSTVFFFVLSSSAFSIR